MSLAVLPAQKKCGRCQTVKASGEFSRCKSRGDGLHTRCKACAREHYLSRRPAAIANMKEYRERNRETLLPKQRANWAANRDARLAKQREYQAANKEALRESDRRYRVQNKEKVAEKNRKNYLANKPARAEYARTWSAERRRTDPLFRLKSSLRARTNGAIRRGGFSKQSSMSEFLGCDWDALKAHIELHFAPGMTWANYGSVWVIDHHVPLASATTAEDLFRLCHYSNLRPLGKVENLRKAAKMPKEMG